MSKSSNQIRHAALACALFAGTPLAGQTPITANGFFVEEAYSQEADAVQQIARYTSGRGGSWLATLEQEWPIFSERHQLSLELELDEDQLQAFELGYQFMFLGGEDDPLTVGAGLSATEARGGKTEFEATLPVSLAFGDGWTSNSNVGASFTPGEDEVGWTVGEGLVRRVGRSLNLMVEGLYSSDESPIPGDETRGGLFVIPGLQYSFDLSPRVQLVPGVAVPIGVGKANGERGVLLYLSIEHPIPRLR